MLKLTEVGKDVGNIPLPRKPLGQEESRASLLRNPRKYIETHKPLDDIYLEGLIQKNIINEDSSGIGANLISPEIRALILSLSQEHKRKFSEIVKSFEADKEMIRGAIFSGGEIRVIAECGSALVINAISELLGITYTSKNQKPTFNTFSGSSAGSYPASGLAVRALNSMIFKVATDTDFTSFYRSPETLEKWINEFISKGYYLATGKCVDELKIKHLQELGSNLQVLVGERRRLLGMPEIFLMPRDIKRQFGIDPRDLPVTTMIRATSNLPFLFWDLWDKTCGDCFITDKKGKKHYLFDAGIFQKNLLPLHLLIEEIENYKEGKISKPGFYFIVGHKEVDSNEIPDKMFGKPTPKLIYWFYSVGSRVVNFVDKYILFESSEKIKELGATRGYLEAVCEATCPKTKKVAKLSSGRFEVPQDEREILLLANIPTSDFQNLGFNAVIDQMHCKLVDPLYISSNGALGKTAYQLYLEDVNKAIGKRKPYRNVISLDKARTIFEARQKITENVIGF